MILGSEVTAGQAHSSVGRFHPATAKITDGEGFRIFAGIPGAGLGLPRFLEKVSNMTTLSGPRLGARHNVEDSLNKGNLCSVVAARMSVWSR